jgi:hypothetical protein
MYKEGKLRIETSSKKTQQKRFSRYLACKSKQTNYIICNNDEATNPAAQRYHANQLEGEQIELNTGHSPFWSHPDLVWRKY